MKITARISPLLLLVTVALSVVGVEVAKAFDGAALSTTRPGHTDNPASLLDRLALLGTLAAGPGGDGRLLVPVQAPGPPAGSCPRIESTSTICQRLDTGAIIITIPVTRDLIGQTIDLTSLTAGTSVVPRLQQVQQGDRAVAFELRGASRGTLVQLATKIMSPSRTDAADGDFCCSREFGIGLSTPRICPPDTPTLRPLSLRPVSLGRPPVRARVRIDKQCSACVAGGLCSCRITVRNVGADPIPERITIEDEARSSGKAVGAVAAFRPDGDGWQCTRTPTGAVCALAPNSLGPVSARHVDIAVATPVSTAGREGRVQNCARLVGDAVQASGPQESCVDFGSDLTVRKSGPAQCRQGEPCAFDVTIANLGRGVFDGTVVLRDETLVDTSGLAAELVAIEPPLNCESAPNAMPMTCKTALRLGVAESRTHRITLKLTPTAGANLTGGPASGRNCISIMDASTPPGSQDVLRSDVRRRLMERGAPDPGASQGANTACVTFAAVSRCPGDLVSRGTQCVCPDGGERQADNSCRAACAPGQRRIASGCVADPPTYVRPPIEPPFYPTPPRRVDTCPGDLVRLAAPNGESYCGCRQPLVQRDTSCVLIEQTQQPCPGDLRPYGPPGRRNCRCPDGTEQAAGYRCVQHSTGPTTCPGDLRPYGPPGRQACRCPENTYQVGASQCVRGVKCTGDLQPYGPPGQQTCVCPPGRKRVGYDRCEAARPQTGPCPAPGMVGAPPNCRCPDGQVYQQGACRSSAPPPKCQLAGMIGPPCHCPSGTRPDYRLRRCAAVQPPAPPPKPPPKCETVRECVRRGPVGKCGPKQFCEGPCLAWATKQVCGPGPKLN